MKISVVIPVYNVKSYLSECVESVLRLKSDVEIILVDDGSTDGSGELCDQWQCRDPRITVIHQENGGLSAARNQGIRSCTGEYVMFLDSDDFIDPEETDRMLSQLRPEDNVLLGLYRNFYTASGTFENEQCDGFLSVVGRTPIDHFLEAVPADGQSCYMVAWRYVLKRAFLLQNSLYFQLGIYHEDEEWTQRLLCATDSVLVTDHYFYQYRQQREGAITATVKPKHIWDSFNILDHAKELLNHLEKDSAKELYIKRRMAQIYLGIMINTRILSKDEYASALKRLKEYQKVCENDLAGTIGTAAKISQKVFGVNITCVLLKIARKLTR